MTIEIFVPFWGDPDLLYETVESVRAQRDQDWRLVVIDDVYPDESVPAHFAAIDDPRIEYVRNEVNLGITENFRESVRRATGEHIVILGCDDLLHPNYIFQEQPDLTDTAFGCIEDLETIAEKVL